MPKASDVSVLIVDDQQSMRGICKYILTQLGFNDIIEAKSGRDALGKLEKSNVRSDHFRLEHGRYRRVDTAAR